MTRRKKRALLRFRVSTFQPVLEWQAQAVTALAAVDGVEIVGWTKVEQRQLRGPAGARRGALAEGMVPESLQILEARGLDRPDAGAEEAGSTPGANSTVADVHLDLTGGSGADGAVETWRFRYGPEGLLDPARAARLDFVRTPGRTQVKLVDDATGRTLRAALLAWWRGEEMDRILIDTADWPAALAVDRLAGNEPAEPDPAAPEKVRGAGIARWPDGLVNVAVRLRRVQGTAGWATRHEDWNVGIIDGTINDVAIGSELRAVRWLPRQSGHYAADPFGVERDGVLHVLFEDFDMRRGRGSIAHVALGTDGTFSDRELVLEFDRHLSYPYLVEDGGATYLLPEASAGGSLVLYEAIEFPRRWRPAATLLDGVPAIDASVIEFEGRWWLFATRRDRGPNHSLFVWHAPRLQGPWRPHSANPVKTDAASARSGGTPFIVDGRLYRPCQDDSTGYGSRLVITAVEALSPTIFRERVIRSFAPPSGSRYPDGVHTLSAAGSRTLVDGKRIRFVPAMALLELRRTARRLLSRD